MEDELDTIRAEQIKLDNKDKQENDDEPNLQRDLDGDEKDRALEDELDDDPDIAIDELIEQLKRSKKTYPQIESVPIEFFS